MVCYLATNAQASKQRGEQGKAMQGRQGKAARQAQGTQASKHKQASRQERMAGRRAGVGLELIRGFGGGGVWRWEDAGVCDVSKSKVLSQLVRREVFVLCGMGWLSACACTDGVVRRDIGRQAQDRIR